MKDKLKKAAAPVRFALFFLLLAAVIFLLNTRCVTRDTSTFLPMAEIAARSDVDILFIGSSTVRHAINPKLVTEKSGLAAFDLSIPLMAMEGTDACARYALRHCRPSYTVLVADPETLMGGNENPVVQRRIAPQLTHPLDRLAYWLNLSLGDRDFVGRLLYFQKSIPKTREEWEKALTICRNSEKYRELMNANNSGMRYEGEGFLRVFNETDPDALLRKEAHPWQGDRFPGLTALTKARLLALKRLCERHGSTPVLMIPPTHPVQILSFPAAMEAIEETEEFCRRNGMLFWDFLRMRLECWPDLTRFYFDLGHINGEGADLFSEALGGFLSDILHGRDTAGRFYRTYEEYMQEAPLVNAWLEFTPLPGGRMKIFSDFNGGSNVIPSYRFCTVENGKETMLRDWAQEAQVLEVPVQQVRGKAVRVFVRDEARGGEKPVWFTAICP